MFHERSNKMNTKKQDILEQALLNLQAELGDRLHRQHSWKKGYDAAFVLDGKTVFVTTANEIRAHQLGRLQELKDTDSDMLVAANYISPETRKLLKQREINYIDRAGNTWLKSDLVYIYIEGIRNTSATAMQKSLAFTRTGLKVVFHFLNEPRLVNATYRELAVKTGVALGTVSNVIEGLKEEKFLLRKNENDWIINDYSELLHRWQNEYTQKLRPSLFVKKYRPRAKDFYFNWKNMALAAGAQWGGEPAGDLLTNWLKPEIFTLYTTQTQQEIVKAYEWIPDPSGIIHIYRPFWDTHTEAMQGNHVPPVLAYTDLVATMDSRCIETANKIYEQYLRKQ